MPTNQPPKILTTPPGKPHRGSFASPIHPTSPGARRMSMSMTPQRTTVLSSAGGNGLERVLRRPQGVMAGIVTFTVLSGIAYSLYHKTSLNTSIYSHLPEPSNFFARKSNFINQYLVKKSWGWTSIIYIIHLLTAPTPSNPTTSSRIERRYSRFMAFLLATAIWLGFTTWFFGAGLGDRVIQLSGGSCAVALPSAWNLDLENLTKVWPKDFPAIGQSENAGESETGQLYLPLPHSFCHSNTPLTPTSHPDLFALLSSTSEIFPTDKNTNTLHPTSDHPELVIPRPRWYKGFDISGHTFLLTLSTMMLTRELAPSWRRFARGPLALMGDDGRGWIGVVHRMVTGAGTGLVGLWIWMLLMTAVWFHNPPEKITGLLLGLTATYLINLLTPTSPFIPTTSYLSSTTETGAGGSARPYLHKDDDDSNSSKEVGGGGGVTDLDENEARRGRVIDEGEVLEFEEEGRGGRQKVE